MTDEDLTKKNDPLEDREFEVEVARYDKYITLKRVKAQSAKEAALKVDKILQDKGWDGLFEENHSEEGQYESCETDIEKVRDVVTSADPRPLLPYELTVVRYEQYSARKIVLARSAEEAVEAGRERLARHGWKGLIDEDDEDGDLDDSWCEVSHVDGNPLSPPPAPAS